MIDRAHTDRKKEDQRVKLGLIFGSRFEKVTCNADHIMIEHKSHNAKIDLCSRKITECGDDVLRHLISEVLSNVDEVDAPALVNFIK